MLFLAFYLAVTTLAALVVMPRDDLLLRIVAFLLALLVIPLAAGTFIRALRSPKSL